jgi:hypothetical protein
MEQKAGLVSQPKDRIAGVLINRTENPDKYQLIDTVLSESVVRIISCILKCLPKYQER